MVVFYDLFDVEALNVRMQEQYKGKEPYKRFTAVMRDELCSEMGYVILIVILLLLSFCFKQKHEERWFCRKPVV